jgi:hypothetical protein
VGFLHEGLKPVTLCIAGFLEQKGLNKQRWDFLHEVQEPVTLGIAVFLEPKGLNKQRWDFYMRA